MTSHSNTYFQSRGRARLGIVVPFSNTNLEPDMQMLRPNGISLHFARAGGYDLDEVPDSDQIRGFALASLDEVITSLAAARPNVYIYGCTSATLAHGPEFDQEFAQKISDMVDGKPAITAAGALVLALKTLGAKNIGFSSPYVEALNEEAIEFLGKSGFETVSSAYVGEDLGNQGQGEVTPERVVELGLAADSPQAEAIVLSCTDMRAVEAIEELEQRLGKPVVTSNQALMFAAAKLLNLTDEEVVPAGQLFAYLNKNPIIV
ncbi:MAG: Asp/Glu racemase [Anaerolineae bacterium]